MGFKNLKEKIRKPKKIETFVKSFVISNSIG
jgi:hypothetical protein